MKFIVNNKIYDTDKAELLCKFQKQWETRTIIGTLYLTQYTSLYRTAKGAYFLTYTGDYDNSYIEVIDEAEAKEYLMHNNYEKYAEMFGELEEA